MTHYASLPVDEGRIQQTLASLVTRLLEQADVDAVMAPQRQPYGVSVMQSLITTPEEAARVDPLAPVVPVSSATQLARLTRKESRFRVAAFLRPCEVRAMLELVKLKQASLEHTLLIGMDCYGRYANREYQQLLGENDHVTLEFLKAASNGRGTELSAGLDIVTACQTCVTPVADNVDLRLQVIGHDPGSALGLEATSEAGERVFAALDLVEGVPPARRKPGVDELTARRQEARSKLRERTREQVGSIEGLMEVLSGCVNCYNCRAACPVCYCRECVFATDTFQHDSAQYFGWAQKRGSLRMPTDTLFYHLTRMAHISTLCVGCGQCSTACPNDVPVADICGLVGEGTQAVFGYVPGRRVDELQPLATFVDDELVQITGQVK